MVRLHFLHDTRPEIFPHECVDECMVSMTTLAGLVDLSRVRILLERRCAWRHRVLDSARRALACFGRDQSGICQRHIAFGQLTERVRQRQCHAMPQTLRPAFLRVVIREHMRSARPAAIMNDSHADHKRKKMLFCKWWTPFLVICARCRMGAYSRSLQHLSMATGPGYKTPKAATANGMSCFVIQPHISAACTNQMTQFSHPGWVLQYSRRPVGGDKML